MLDLTAVLNHAVTGLRLSERTLLAAIENCRQQGMSTRDAEYGLDRNREALAAVGRLTTIAEGITYDCDDGRERVALGDEYREMVSTPDRSRSYGLRWSVDGETPEDAEAEALLVLASALRCRYLQEVQPCL